MKSPAPYLSIILTARNDNYGGDFNERLQNSLNWLTCLVEKNKLPTELLIVDYNSIPEDQPLAGMINWPQGRNYLSIRLLHVPNEIHRRMVNPEVRRTVPLFEFPAKNMGIRRAKGEYLLCTNADILFHPNIIRFMAMKIPDRKHYYRTDRFDYKRIDSYDFNNPNTTLRRIQQKVFRLMLKGYAYDVKRGENFFEETSFRLKNSWRMFKDRNMVRIEPIAHQWEISVNYDGFLMKYHTHCSGDFMLMHRDHWLSLRGYPEDTYISTHADAIFTVMSRISGLRECALGWPVYHQDHERRYNTDFSEVKNNEAINGMFKRLLNETRWMETERRPKIVNPDDWGYPGENFAETVI